MKKFLAIPVVIIISLLAVSIYIMKQASSEKLVEIQVKPQLVSPTPTPTIVKITRMLIKDVPFAPQAPFAEWKDPRFQDACEEAAALMAVYFARGNKNLDKAKVREEILAQSLYQTEKFQEFRDTSLQDSAERLIKGYFNYNNFEVKENINLEDIKSELLKGNLIIVPTNGQVLGNPHFTQPGPERHNIVIRGFDDAKNIFLTNDPGIKEGELYEYPQSVLFNAIRDYPTGYHLPITEVKKNMIVVKKSYG